MPEEKISRVHLRGFAALSPKRRREIASSGGKRAHELGTAHKWDSSEAREAGRRGGLARNQKDEREE
jgi:general stress protein YciG